jgi:hypothetical protein
MSTELYDLILTGGLALGTIVACALAIYLLPWTDGELEATERLGHQVADGVGALRSGGPRARTTLATLSTT